MHGSRPSQPHEEETPGPSPHAAEYYTAVNRDRRRLRTASLRLTRAAAGSEAPANGTHQGVLRVRRLPRNGGARRWGCEGTFQSPGQGLPPDAAGRGDAHTPRAPTSCARGPPRDNDARRSPAAFEAGETPPRSPSKEDQADASESEPMAATSRSSRTQRLPVTRAGPVSLVFDAKTRAELPAERGWPGASPAGGSGLCLHPGNAQVTLVPLEKERKKQLELSGRRV